MTLLFLAGCLAPPAESDHKGSDACLVDCESDADTDADSDADTDADADSDSDSDSDADPGRRFDHFVTTTDTYNADDSCLGDAQPEPDESRHEVMRVNGTVLDFQTEDPVPDATIQWWTDDDANGSVDVEASADANGKFELSSWSCQAQSYRASTPPEWEETVDTMVQHRVYGWEADGQVVVNADSVSVATARVIPSILGVAWDSDTALISGVILDCDGDPVQYTQVFIHDEDGNGAPGVEVYYFDGNDFPAAHDQQENTNDNGLFVALNLPPNDWIADAWGWDGSDYVLLGSTPILALAGSVTVVDIGIGNNTGVIWPASCLL